MSKTSPSASLRAMSPSTWLRAKVLAQSGTKKGKLANVMLLTESFDFLIWKVEAWSAHFRHLTGPSCLSKQKAVGKLVLLFD